MLVLVRRMIARSVLGGQLRGQKDCRQHFRGEEWLTAAGDEDWGRCEKWGSDGCKGIYQLWAQDLKELGVIWV